MHTIGRAGRRKGRRVLFLQSLDAVGREDADVRQFSNMYSIIYFPCFFKNVFEYAVLMVELFLVLFLQTRVGTYITLGLLF